MNETSFVLLQAFQATCLIVKLIYTCIFTFLSFNSPQPPTVCSVTISQVFFIILTISLALFSTITSNIIHAGISSSLYLVIYFLNLIKCGLDQDPVHFILDLIISIILLNYFFILAYSPNQQQLNPYKLMKNRNNFTNSQPQLPPFSHSQSHSTKNVDLVFTPKLPTTTSSSSSPFYASSYP